MDTDNKFAKKNRIKLKKSPLLPKENQTTTKHSRNKSN